MPRFQAVNEVADAKAARKKRQAFYTPEPLVAKLVEWADVCPDCRCLEPSAGDGRIVHHLRADGVAAVDACEIEAGMHARIADAGGTVVGADFLKYAPGPVYDRIVMNPPFAGRQGDRHIEHAWGLLRPRGKLLAVAPPTTGQRLERGELKLPGCEWATFENVGGDWFKDFGTGIAVIVVELERWDGPGDPVEGFRNLPTFNAAMTVLCDEGLTKRWREAGAQDDPAKRPTAVRAKVVREIALSGGSVYGIDWGEVHEAVCRPDEPAAQPVARRSAKPPQTPGADLFAGLEASA